MAAARRDTDEQLAAIAISWRTAALTASAMNGKLPPLQSILARAKMSRLGQEERLSMQLSHLSEHLGVGVRPLSPEARAALARLHGQ